MAPVTVAVLSGKGGVGKSSVCAQLALALAAQRRRTDGRRLRIGVLDIDLTGPSMPLLLLGADNANSAKVTQGGRGWLPIKRSDCEIYVMSLGFLLDSPDDAVVWRGPRKTAVIKQLLKQVEWPADLDVILIDTPPGTSDEHITLAEALQQENVVRDTVVRDTNDASMSNNISNPLSASSLSTGISRLDAVVLVTTPQHVALLDVQKEISFCRKAGLHIAGLIENMSGYICPHCGSTINVFASGGGQHLAESSNLPFLGTIAMDSGLSDFFERNADKSSTSAADSYSASHPNQVSNAHPNGTVKNSRDGIVHNFCKERNFKVVNSIAQQILRTLVPRPSLRLLGTLEGHTGRVWDVKLKANLSIAATASADHSVRVWNIRTMQCLSKLEDKHTRSVRSLAWQDDEDKPSEDSCSDAFKTKKESTQPLQLCTASFDGTAAIWAQVHPPEEDTINNYENMDKIDFHCVAVLEGHENEVKAIALSATGLIATCSRDKSIWIWEEVFPDYDCVSVLQEHTQDVKCIEWHPHEELLASGSYDNIIRFWRDDSYDWSCCCILRGHNSTVWSISFNGLGDHLVSASADGTVRLWQRLSSRNDTNDTSLTDYKPTTGQSENWSCIQTISIDQLEPLYSIDWAQNGLVATAGQSGCIYILKPHRLSSDGQNERNDDEIHSVMSCDEDITEDSAKDISGSLKLGLVCRFQGAHSDLEINNVSWAQLVYEDILLSCGDDNTAKIWSTEL